MNFVRQQVPLLIALVTGLVMIAQYYVPNRLSQTLGSRAADSYIIVQGIVIYLGILSLLHVHIRKISRREAGWGYSLFVFLGMVAMVAAGIHSRGRFDPGTTYKWAYDHTIVPLGGTLFSILAFFIASAAFRAFRARSLDATLLLLAAVIVMFGNVFWGEYLVGWASGNAQLARTAVAWIMDVPNVAAFRGIVIGVALGIIATSLKIIFGIERGYLGDSE